MYPITLGYPFSVQQKVTGGVFDGTDRGRASVTLPTFPGGTSQLRVRARRYGTASNVYRVQLVDPGTGTTYPTTTAALVGAVVTVTLSRSPSAITATPNDVAAAINAVQDPGFPVRAEVIGSGSPLATAVASTALTSGLDPVVRGNGSQFLWSLGATSQGFFHFEHDEPLVIRKVEMLFTSPPTATAKLYTVTVNDNFTPDMSEAIPLIVRDVSLSQPDFTVTDIKDPLMPGQALVLVFAAAGLVRIVAERAGRYPLL